MTRTISVTCDGCGKVVSEEFANNNWWKFNCEKAYGSLLYGNREILGGIEEFDFCNTECILLLIEREEVGGKN